ncbi:carbohydrate deacetylase-like isoform X2 [Lineus longissimus]
MTTRQLIINADDFGYCRQRNNGIVACYKAGGITSASLMVNASEAGDAVKQAKQVGLPIGLHLNLTEGYPVSSKTKDSAITNSEGLFLGKLGFPEKILSGSFDCDAVRNEIEAQIELFSHMCGALPVHVDGHQHAHVIPGVCEIFASVMQQYGIKWTRLPVDRSLKDCDWLDSMPDRKSFLQKVVLDSEKTRTVYDEHAIRYPKKYVGMTTMGSMMTVERLQEQLASAFQNILPRNDYARNSEGKGKEVESDARGGGDCGMYLPEVSTCELMVHPGYVNVDEDGGCGAGPDRFSKSPDREHEMNILMSADMIKFYQKEGYKLCSYCDLS